MREGKDGSRCNEERYRTGWNCSRDTRSGDNKTLLIVVWWVLIVCSLADDPRRRIGAVDANGLSVTLDLFRSCADDVDVVVRRGKKAG